MSLLILSITSVRPDMCVNGSQLKKVIKDYKGRFKSLGAIVVPVDKLLVINENEELVISCKYIPEADNKLSNPKLF